MKWLSLLANKSIRLVVAVIFFMLAMNGQLRANPVPSPPADFGVSEILFDSDGKWTIEIASLIPWNYQQDFFPDDVDSICITSSTERVKVHNLPHNEYGYIPGYFLLRNDSLDSNLTIKQTGDYIKVTTYYKYPQWYFGEDAYSHTNTLVFGDYPGATVRSPGENESIVWISGNSYSINKTPMLGQIPKDGSDTHSTIQFKIFYPDGQLFTASNVKLHDDKDNLDINLVRQGDGAYSGEAYYCSYNLSKMYFNMQMPPGYIGYWLIRPLNISMYWDLWGTPTYNIYLDQFVDIKTIQKEDNILKVFPNPVKEHSFYYETTLPVKSTNSVIEIIGLNGQKIGRYPISENKGNIKLSSNISRGVYTICLIVNNKNYANTKILVQ